MNKDIVQAYLRITDIMFQAIKVRKFEIFESALKDRQKLIDRLGEENIDFSMMSDTEKAEFSKAIESLEKRIEDEMVQYRKELDMDLKTVHSSLAKLRKHSQVKNYYGKNYGNQGAFINRLK